MTTAVANKSETAVARPLKILEPLIQQDIEDGDRAGKEFYRHAGEKLIEAQDGHFEDNTTGFYKWAEKKFAKTSGTIRLWIGFARASSSKSFESVREFRRAPKNKGGLGQHRGKEVYREWTPQVDAVAERARREAFRLVQDDALSRAEERDAERALAHRLIDIGYKVLAKELHPDKVGGSRDAMKRLNHVRDKLKHSI